MGTDDRTAAERIKGRYLLRPYSEAAPPDEDEVFYHELLGMQVETDSGDVVGSVTEVYELAPADLLEVEGPDGTRLIPFSRQVVVEVDRSRGRIVVSPPEGLLDL